MAKLIVLVIIFVIIFICFYIMYKDVVNRMEAFDKEAGEVRKKWLEIIEEMGKEE